jgi:hypothetical protein
MEYIEKPPTISESEIQRPHAREKEKRSTRGGFRETKWQKKLLPFMIIVLSLVMLFFFTASALQLYYLHQRIERSPELDLNPALGLLESNPAGASERDKLEVGRWKTLSILEGNALQRRYHQANVLLMSRIWTGYLGFVTGMILALVGATFILGKLRESESQVDAGSELWKLSITTASPGLVLAVLGTILMITTMVSHYEIKVDDGQLYTAGWNGTDNPASPDQVDALPPPATFPSEGEDEVIKTSDSKAKEKNRGSSQSKDDPPR